MTSGKRTEPLRGRIPRRRFVGAVAVLSAGLIAGARAAAQGTGTGGAAGTFDLEALMALLAQRKSGEARFTEERTVAGFDSPLRASGTLSFVAPDRFVRQTLEPRRERMEVAGNVVRLERGGRSRQMALDAVPELEALLEGLRGTLSGNAALLRKHFDVRVAGHAGLWTLTLTPRDITLSLQVRLMQIVGAAADLRSVELQMAGNQRSLMTIEPVTDPSSAATGASAAPAAPAGAAATPPAAGASR